MRLDSVVKDEIGASELYLVIFALDCSMGQSIKSKELFPIVF
jgi:hypothetical protein